MGLGACTCIALVWLGQSKGIIGNEGIGQYQGHSGIGHIRRDILSANHRANGAVTNIAILAGTWEDPLGPSPCTGLYIL